MKRANGRNSGIVDVVILGAGPYGLSIAAHLQARGVDFRIFGGPMSTWQTQMPKGMRLKSEGFASSLFDPESTFTLRHYCEQRGLPYADTGLPVPLETFIAYGEEFQKKFVPQLENKLAVGVQRAAEGFHIRLEDGEVVAAKKLVIAAGISHFSHMPPELVGLPESLVTHSSQHSALEQFKGRDVVVVGAGASALDLAALLHQAGAAVQLIARKPVIRFHDPPKPRSLSERLRAPMTGIGPGWKLFFYANLPQLFRYLPEEFRLNAVRKTLGPAPGWFVKDQVVGKVPFTLDVNITQAETQNGRIALQLVDRAGARKTVVADHVIAATGYKVDLQRLEFLSAEIQAAVKVIDKAPVLTGNFESSVPGLYFVGTSAANTFGPLMRFAVGAKFAAGRVASHLSKSVSRKAVEERADAGVEALERG